jgi:hypothetical protein
VRLRPPSICGWMQRSAIRPDSESAVFARPIFVRLVFAGPEFAGPEFAGPEFAGPLSAGHAAGLAAVTASRNARAAFRRDLPSATG